VNRSARLQTFLCNSCRPQSVVGQLHEHFAEWWKGLHSLNVRRTSWEILRVVTRSMRIPMWNLIKQQKDISLTISLRRPDWCGSLHCQLTVRERRRSYSPLFRMLTGWIKFAPLLGSRRYFALRFLCKTLLLVKCKYLAHLNNPKRAAQFKTCLASDNLTPGKSRLSNPCIAIGQKIKGFLVVGNKRQNLGYAIKTLSPYIIWEICISRLKMNEFVINPIQSNAKLKMAAWLYSLLICGTLLFSGKQEVTWITKV